MPSTLNRWGAATLVRFGEDTLRQRPLWIRLIIEFLGTFILVSIILNTATEHRSIGHNVTIAVGSTVALLGAVRQLDRSEREAAEGGALPILGPNGPLWNG